MDVYGRLESVKRKTINSNRRDCPNVNYKWCPLSGTVPNTPPPSQMWKKQWHERELVFTDTCNDGSHFVFVKLCRLVDPFVLEVVGRVPSVEPRRAVGPVVRRGRVDFEPNVLLLGHFKKEDEAAEKRGKYVWKRGALQGLFYTGLIRGYEMPKIISKFP